MSPFFVYGTTSCTGSENRWFLQSSGYSPVIILTLLVSNVGMNEEYIFQVPQLNIIFYLCVSFATFILFVLLIVKYHYSFRFRYLW